MSLRSVRIRRAVASHVSGLFWGDTVVARVASPPLLATSGTPQWGQWGAIEPCVRGLRRIPAVSSSRPLLCWAPTRSLCSAIPKFKCLSALYPPPPPLLHLTISDYSDSDTVTADDDSDNDSAYSTDVSDTRKRRLSQ